MTEVTGQPKRRTGLLIWLIGSQLLAIASLRYWIVMAGLSVMAFDSGSSTLAWAIVIAAWAYPLFPLSMAVSAWLAFLLRKNRLAAVLTGLTIVVPAFVALLLLIGP